jgi:hypothetical protein
MAGDYTTTTLLKARMKETTSANDTAFAALVTAMSRLVDRYTGREPGYFDDGSSGSLANRIFFGEGADSLLIDAYITQPTDPTSVTMPTAYTVPDFDVKTTARGTYLVRRYGDDELSGAAFVDNQWVSGLGSLFVTDGLDSTSPIGWPKGIPVTVRAIWGFDGVPDDIAEATLQLCVRSWRGGDEAFSGVIGNINTDGSIVERGEPAIAKLILDNYRNQPIALFA